MDDLTYSLFDESELKAMEKKRGDLIIRKGIGKELSKEQKYFNRLIKRIDNLRQSIDQEREKLETLLKAYNDSIPKLNISFSEYQLQLARNLANAAGKWRFSNRQHDTLRDVILFLCDNAFQIIEPDEEMIALYNSWSDVSYEEELMMQEEHYKRIFAQQAKILFDLDLDPDDFDDSPEAYARISAQVRARIDEMEREMASTAPPRRKTQKQLEKEERLKHEEELKRRSVREIYLMLAKALHPDAASHLEDHEEREEMMKKATVAYKENDLPTLLALEMEWVASREKALDGIPDDTLKLYITALKEQVTQLTQIRYYLYMEPRYQVISDFSRNPHHEALKNIEEFRDELLDGIQSMGELVAITSGNPSKKLILEFIDTHMHPPHHENIPYSIFSDLNNDVPW